MLITCSLAVGGQAPERPPEKAFTPVGRMDAVIKESSGIAKSLKYEGIFWTHGDSGNPAALFAIRTDGTLVATVPVVEAVNLDWEDIAIADGFVYVGDIGNNFGWLRVRTVYKFAEPDPYAGRIEPVKPVVTYHYKFPEEPFDAEALVVRREQIYIIRKTAGPTSAVYRLTPADSGHFGLAKVQDLRAAWITGADLSADGRYLVTVSGFQLTVYPVNEDLTLRVDETPRSVSLPPSGQIEACCFDGGDVVLTSEEGSIYRITAEDLARQTRFVSPRVEGRPATSRPEGQ
ncbi:MAG: hypothetical protein V2A79_18755 [Planctomycetota bacterium]